jgi:hypothetical protein
VPGATATLVLSAPTEIATTKPLSTAFTTTGYTVFNITRTLTIGTFVTAVTMPTFVYGLIEEACNLAYEISRSRIEPMRLPATVVIAFEGTTFRFPGFTFTMTAFTEFVTRDPALENLRTTLTVTKRGETNTATVYIEPTTIVLNTRVEGSTVTTTVVMPGTTYVRTYTVTRTLTEQVTTVTETRTATAAQPTQAQPAVTVTMTPAPGERAEQLFDPITLGIIAAIAIAVVVGVLLGYRRGRY